MNNLGHVRKAVNCDPKVDYKVDQGFQVFGLWFEV